MSSRPLITPAQVIIDGDMSADIISKPTIITNVTMVSYQVVWDGTGCDGEMLVQVSNDYRQNAAGEVSNPGNWTTLILSGPATVSGDQDSGVVNLSDLSCYAIRIMYVRAAGTGTMQATLMGKVQ